MIQEKIMRFTVLQLNGTSFDLFKVSLIISLEFDLEVYDLLKI